MRRRDSCDARAGGGEDAGEISYASAATVNLTFRESDFDGPPRAFGFVVPAIERRRIIAGSFSSFKFEGRAPAGAILARAFVGGEMSREMMRLATRRWWPRCATNFANCWESARRRFSPKSGDGPTRCHSTKSGIWRESRRSSARSPEIPAFAIAGAAYRGVGIPDCIRSGEAAADAIFAKLSTPK